MILYCICFLGSVKTMRLTWLVHPYMYVHYSINTVVVWITTQPSVDYAEDLNKKSWLPKYVVSASGATRTEKKSGIGSETDNAAAHAILASHVSGGLDEKEKIRLNWFRHLKRIFLTVWYTICTYKEKLYIQGECWTLCRFFLLGL